MKAGDLMTARPFVVVPEEPVLRAAEIMRDHFSNTSRRRMESIGFAPAPSRYCSNETVHSDP